MHRSRRYEQPRTVCTAHPLFALSLITSAVFFSCPHRLPLFPWHHAHSASTPTSSADYMPHGPSRTHRSLSAQAVRKAFLDFSRLRQQALAPSASLTDVNDDHFFLGTTTPFCRSRTGCTSTLATLSGPARCGGGPPLEARRECPARTALCSARTPTPCHLQHSGAMAVWQIFWPPAPRVCSGNPRASALARNAPVVPPSVNPALGRPALGRPALGRPALGQRRGRWAEPGPSRPPASPPRPRRPRRPSAPPAAPGRPLQRPLRRPLLRRPPPASSPTAARRHPRRPARRRRPRRRAKRRLLGPERQAAPSRTMTSSAYCTPTSGVDIIVLSFLYGTENGNTIPSGTIEQSCTISSSGQGQQFERPRRGHHQVPAGRR